MTGWSTSDQLLFLAQINERIISIGRVAEMSPKFFKDWHSVMVTLIFKSVFLGKRLILNIFSNK